MLLKYSRYVSIILLIFIFNSLAFSHEGDDNSGHHPPPHSPGDDVNYFIIRHTHPFGTEDHEDIDTIDGHSFSDYDKYHAFVSTRYGTEEYVEGGTNNGHEYSAHNHKKRRRSHTHDNDFSVHSDIDPDNDLSGYQATHLPRLFDDGPKKHSHFISPQIGTERYERVSYITGTGSNKYGSIVQTKTSSPPEFNDGESTTRSVAENTRVNENIGTPVAATDSNSADSLTYSLGGTDASSFDIDSATGQLKTKAALDYESGKTSYSVTVKVTDSTNKASIDVTIKVTNVGDIPTTFEKVSGDSQSALVNESLSNPLVVQVLDELGAALSGVAVSFSVSPTATLGSASATTAANGQASTTLTLGSTPGTYTVTASVSGVSDVTFTATASNPPPAAMSVISGDNQSALINEKLPDPLVVRIVDQNDVALSGVMVSFSVSPSGTLGSASATTGSDGQASTTLTLGSTPGTYTVTATAPNSLEKTFTATANSPIIPTTFEKVSGDNQTALINQSVSNPLVVRVLDQNGDGISGVTVDFSVSPSGTLGTTSTRTGSNGQASTTLTLGSTTGTYTVTASVSGLTDVTFTATANSPPPPSKTPTTLEKVSGDNQSALINQSLANPIVVRVLDENSDALAGVTVSFSVSPSGTLGSTSTTTGSDGQASTTLTLGSTTGNYTVTASVSGLTDVTFTATTNSPPPPSTDDNQIAEINQPLTNPQTSVSPKAKIVVSEIMFETKGEIENYPQWIELYNNGASNTDASDINLNGWEIILSDDRSFSIDDDLIIKPNDTVLLVSHLVRFSENIVRDNLYELDDTIIDESTLNNDFFIRLYDDEDREIDQISTLDVDDNSRWNMPVCIVQKENDARTSIIRRFSEGEPVKGNKRIGWIRAYDTKGAKNSTFWYGDETDIGTPGYRSDLKPLPVQLSLFTAKFDGDKVCIEWITESEIDNAGFNIYRSETRNGQFRQVNVELIQGAGTTGERNTYTWTDTTAKPNVEYYYQIEDVSFAGNRQTLTTARTKGIVSAKDRFVTQWGALKR